MKSIGKILNIVLAFAFSALFSIPVAAANVAPRTGDTIMITAIVVVVAVALFVFIKRRRR